MRYNPDRALLVFFALMTMHDLNIAMRYVDKFLFIKGGTIYNFGGEKSVTPEIKYRNGHPVIFPIEDLDDRVLGGVNQL